MTSAAALRDQALAAARAGRREEAARIFDDAADRHPRDAALLNSIGGFHAGQGAPAIALGWYERALAVDPTHDEAALNRAIMLTRLKRGREAATALRDREAGMARHPRYWTARGAAELAAADPIAAQKSYDAALKADPGNARAIQGRTQVALDRGAPDAVAWHERALAAVPGDRFVIRGYARALEAAGRVDEALALTQALATRLPDWIEGLEAHAAMRWAAGDRTDFCDHFAAAAASVPSPALYAAWAQTLSGVDRARAAADVAAEGRRRWPDATGLALIEASAAGIAGDDARAKAILSHHASEGDPLWDTERARHLLRRRDPIAAEAVLARVLDRRPDDIAAWSLRDVAWRLTGDPRHEWLSGQDGMTRVIALDLSEDGLTRVRTLLDGLHDRAAMPIGQSVKHGSQTRGALFARTEPELLALAGVIDRALAEYRNGLPPADPSHPLLRHRDSGWSITGSWSIRLRGEGRHAAHIHPRGIVSSASYFLVPPGLDTPQRPGWLELGRPPASLHTGLEALRTICPRVGTTILFPSFLFHGTRPIDGGTRLTVAFDVAVD